MKSKTPLVSVVMPVYNAEMYVREAVESILKQVFSDYEFLIIDDGSNDRTRDIICTIHDPRIRVLSLPHRGIAEALNYGIREARGYYIARMDADDRAIHDRLSIQISCLEKCQDAVLVAGDVSLIDGRGASLGKRTSFHRYNGQIREALLSRKNPINHSTVIYRRDAVIGLGGYDGFFSGTTEDYELWLRLSECNKMIIMKEVVIELRKHNSNLSLGPEQGVYGLTALILHKAYLRTMEYASDEGKTRCLSICRRFYDGHLRERLHGVERLKRIWRTRTLHAVDWKAVKALWFMMHNRSCIMRREVEGLVDEFLDGGATPRNYH